MCMWTEVRHPGEAGFRVSSGDVLTGEAEVTERALESISCKLIMF